MDGNIPARPVISWRGLSLRQVSSQQNSKSSPATRADVGGGGPGAQCEPLTARRLVLRSEMAGNNERGVPAVSYELAG